MKLMAFLAPARAEDETGVVAKAVQQVSMKLIASIAPTRAEDETRVVAKADKKKVFQLYYL